MARVSKKKLEEIKNRKQIMVGVNILTICFMLFVMVKGFCLFYYNPIRSGLVSIKEEMLIANEKMYGNSFIDALNMTIPEEFVENKDFFDDETDMKIYFLDNNIDKSYISIAKSSSGLFSNSDLFNHVNDYKSVFSGYGISNESELLNYYFNSNHNPTIFNSLSKIKMNYMANVYVNLIMAGEELQKLSGDIEGYMYQNTQGFIVKLYYGDESYSVTFMDREDSEYFNEMVVLDMLETVYFK